jgi:hypothetical protein
VNNNKHSLPHEYHKKPTQEQRILQLLKNRGKSGVKVWELVTPRPHGLGISQYNARIYGLREKGFNIVNKTPGHFVLIQNEKPEQLNFMPRGT